MKNLPISSNKFCKIKPINDLGFLDSSPTYEYNLKNKRNLLLELKFDNSKLSCANYITNIKLISSSMTKNVWKTDYSSSPGTIALNKIIRLA